MTTQQTTNRMGNALGWPICPKCRGNKVRRPHKVCLACKDEIRAEIQPDLFKQVVAVKYEKGATIQQRFDVFDAANPHVWARIKEKAEALLAKGAKRISIKAIYEVLRYEHFVTTGDTYKLNNDFTALYGRNGGRDAARPGSARVSAAWRCSDARPTPPHP